MCKQTIDRSKTVNSVVWLPNGQGEDAGVSDFGFLLSHISLSAILSVEGSEVVRSCRSWIATRKALINTD